MRRRGSTALRVVFGDIYHSLALNRMDIQQHQVYNVIIGCNYLK